MGSTGGFLAYVRSIKQTVIVDDHTIRFVTNGPAATLPAELEEVFIVSQHAVSEAGPDGFRTGAAAIGTGPYRFVSWQPNASEVLERWDGYWGARKPDWQRVTFTEISEDASRIAALLSGQVDLINYVAPAGVASLAANPKIGVFKGPSIYVYILHPDGRETSPLVTDLNDKPLAHSPFRDVRVRRAMSMVIDRNAIASVTMEGLATPARALMPLNFVGVDPHSAPLAYDVAGARKLMAEAGYPNGFKVRLTCTNNRLPNDSHVCTTLAQMLIKIGIHADVAALPQAVYFNDFSNGAYSLSMNGWGTMTGDAIYMLSSLAYTRDKDPNLGTFNRSRYSNPEIDRITKAALAEADPDKRIALLRQGMDLLRQDVAYIPIVNLSTVWAGNATKLRYVPQMNEDTLAIEALRVGK
jgi:peptide/nickel transport system substrate-binding protein